MLFVVAVFTAGCVASYLWGRPAAVAGPASQSTEQGSQAHARIVEA